MHRLDSLLPEWQFSEVHHIHSRASAQALLAAADAYDPAGDGLIGAAMALREAPGRLAAALGRPSALARRPRFGRADFTPLQPASPDCVALGLVGRFWEPGYGLVPVADTADFLACQPPGAAKLLMGFVTTPFQQGTRLTTVTRVACADAGTRARLAVYWALIRPVSGLIRRRMLASMRRSAEASTAAR